MFTRRNTISSLAALGAAATMPAAVNAKPTGARFLEYRDIKAAPLPDQRLTIWLPPGYDTSAKRYRVLYMHDCQNLFDPALSNFNKVWAADKAMMGHAEATGADPWIIVGIWSPDADRYRQYMPEPAYNAAGPDLRSRLDPWVDQYLRTLTAPEDTAIIGSSMGGLISLYAFLEYPKVFGRAGCVSTHWPGTAPQTVGEVDAEMLSIWQAIIAEKLGDLSGRRLWFDHGDATLDAYYPPYQAAIDAQLEATNQIRGTHWESRVYPGAEHEENAWAQRLPDVFRWVLG